MRRPLVILAFLLASTAPAAVTDQALRYVNGEVVTMSDVRLRYEIRQQEYLRQGRVLPSTRDEINAFNQDSLEQLTDEILMVQKAKELKLVPDHDSIVLDVLETAKKLGTGLSLADQARARKEREKQQSIEYLLNYYYSPRTPEATPAELEATYRRHQAEFNRPPRARVLTILLRPSEPSLAKDLRRAEIDLLKRAQDASDAAIADGAKARIADFTKPDSTAADQDVLLAAFLDDLDAAGKRADLDEQAKKLVAAAEDLRAQALSVRDLGQTVEQLEQERAPLVGKDEDAFRAAARRISQGPNAGEGGEQGWVEPGTFPAEVDQRVFTAPAGGVSEVFVANNVAWLVFIQAREEARVRSFDEVAGELEARMRRLRRDAMRAKVTAILRAKASVTDVAPVSSLLE